FRHLFYRFRAKLHCEPPVLILVWKPYLNRLALFLTTFLTTFECTPFGTQNPIFGIISYNDCSRKAAHAVGKITSPAEPDFLYNTG
ncbi:MAG: hypothetical protein JW987_02140, partial [Anaerolineaceae bacterium]|nr:hypothetical protein [Anaerolineaceae bacterium]